MEHKNFSIELTFEINRCLLEIEADGNVILRDFHIFKLMAEVVLKYYGYERCQTDAHNLHVLSELEKTSDFWYRESVQFVVSYCEEWNRCLLMFLNVETNRSKCVQFMTYGLKDTRDAIRENNLKKELSIFFTDFHNSWFSVECPDEPSNDEVEEVQEETIFHPQCEVFLDPQGETFIASQGDTFLHFQEEAFLISQEEMFLDPQDGTFSLEPRQGTFLDPDKLAFELEEEIKTYNMVQGNGLV